MAGGLSTYSVFKHMVLHNQSIHMLSQKEVREVQQILLQMMDDIHNVCEEHHLHYVISGGCALGAIRHGGFIPWDDDMDICMPRRDYDRFRQCFVEHFPDKYYVQEVRACKGYDLNFMKVRLKGTDFCEFLDPEPEKAGIFIDIFSVENAADNRILRTIQWLLSDGMQFICSCLRIRRKRQRLLEMAGDDKGAVRAIRIKSVLAIPFRLIPFRRWLLWTDRILGMNKNEHTKYVSIPAGGKHFKGELYPRDWIFPEEEIEFEDRKYYAMARIECYLQQMYGDYMKIPPEEEREKHALLSFSLPERKME